MPLLHPPRSARTTAHRTVTTLLIAALALIAASTLPSTARAQAQPIDYRLDPGFNGGTPFLDRFAGIAGANYRGKFLVRVPDGESASRPDGDVIVVGEVPGPGQVDNLHGNTNIGMVRYNRQGLRQPLPGGGQFYGHYNDQYVIMPGDEITRINGTKQVVAVTPVHNGFFYVLTNEYYAVPPEVNLLFLRKFSTAGTYHGNLEIIASRFDRREDLIGIDMTLVHDGANSSIVILARYRYLWNVITGCDDGHGCSVILRANLDAQGTATLDTGFGYKRLGEPHDGVNNDEATFRPTAIASGTRGNLSPFIYVAGTHRNAGPVERVKLKKYTASGSYIGQTHLNFRNDPARAETGARIAVGYDNPNGYHNVYVAAQTQQQCAPGMGVAKVRDDGSLAGGFGDGGKIIFGGSDDTLDSQACAYAKAAEPRGMVVDGGRLAIAGQISEDVDWNGVYPTGMLTVIDTASGALVDFAGHFFRAPDGYPIGYATFNSVLPAGGGRYVVAGEQLDQSNQNRPMFTTARVAGAELFADGYE